MKPIAYETHRIEARRFLSANGREIRVAVGDHPEVKISLPGGGWGSEPGLRCVPVVELVLLLQVKGTSP
jgi:hypothetical protein